MHEQEHQGAEQRDWMGFRGRWVVVLLGLDRPGQVQNTRVSQSVEKQRESKEVREDT